MDRVFDRVTVTYSNGDTEDIDCFGFYEVSTGFLGSGPRYLTMRLNRNLFLGVKKRSIDLSMVRSYEEKSMVTTLDGDIRVYDDYLSELKAQIKALKD